MEFMLILMNILTVSQNKFLSYKHCRLESTNSCQLVTKVMDILTVIFLGLFSSLVFGCSIPEGGFVDPGIEGRVYYSTIVAVGTVTEITDDPSFWGSHEYVTTYGANVVIWCSYKGGALPRTIQVGEAGMCFTV